MQIMFTHGRCIDLHAKQSIHVYLFIAQEKLYNYSTNCPTLSKPGLV